MVLVADSSEERGKETAAELDRWGLATYLVHDGVEAMLALQRMLPKAVVLDAALPKMFGFQVCEVVKRNESLRDMKVVLVGAIHQQDRYRRDPSDLYGADVYLERPDLPDGLRPLLRDAGLPLDEPEERSDSESPSEIPDPGREEPEEVFSPPVESEPEPEPEPEPDLELELDLAPPSEPVVTEAPEPALDASADEDEDAEVVAERERAERLARIAVSEMLLYQPEKFDAAIRDGSLETTLDLEIQEARALIVQRISEEVRGERGLHSRGTPACRRATGWRGVTRSLADSEKVALLEGLESLDAEVRRLAVEQVLLLPISEAVEPLSRCLGDEVWRVRKAAVHRLSQCGDHLPVQEMLVASLSDGEKPGSPQFGDRGPRRLWVPGDAATDSRASQSRRRRPQARRGRPGRHRRSRLHGRVAHDPGGSGSQRACCCRRGDRLRGRR